MTYNSGQGLSNNELGQNKEEKEVLKERVLSRDERQMVEDYTPLSIEEVKRQMEEISKPENLLMVVKFKKGKWVSTRINKRCKAIHGM